MSNAQKLAVLTSKQYLVQSGGNISINNNLGFGFDIHKILRKVEKVLPKDSLTLPKHRYCGLQTTPLEEELNEDGSPKPGHEPYNQVDDVCRNHDYLYSKAKNKADKHKADKIMLKQLADLQPKNFREKVDKLITRSLIGVNIRPGWGFLKSRNSY